MFIGYTDSNLIFKLYLIDRKHITIPTVLHHHPLCHYNTSTGQRRQCIGCEDMVTTTVESSSHLIIILFHFHSPSVHARSLTRPRPLSPIFDDYYDNLRFHAQLYHNAPQVQIPPPSIYREEIFLLEHAPNALGQLIPSHSFRNMSTQSPLGSIWNKDHHPQQHMHYHHFLHHHHPPPPPHINKLLHQAQN